ncbi:DUF4192 domain-containing protein [Nocardia jiangxiensis]|uniref:DUF4192 domain-containing protein n=1 Tax=Nocardia jiangxiensis TaxID=282685 RepID=UPI0002EC09C6|nr:DUF4192 domain-containing protein [Nocardia jiangxiensis]
MVYIDNPGALIAAVPRWLAYEPRRSVVLILFFDTDTPDSVVRAGHIARVDLDLPDGSVAVQQVAMAAFSLCGRYRPDALCAIVIDDAVGTSAPIHRYRGLVRSLADRVAVWNIPLLDAWVTPATEPGQPWWSLLYPPTSDTQPAPTVLPGVAAPEPDRAARTAALLAQQPPHPSTEGPELSWVQERVRFVLTVLQGVATGDWPSPEQIAELARCLRDSLVRDCAYGFIGTSAEDPARGLWTLAWQTLPPGHRADAALLAAVASIAADDWATAEAAVASILIDNPEHPLALRLSRLLPDRDTSDLIRRLLHSGQATAAEIGLQIE